MEFMLALPALRASEAPLPPVLESGYQLLRAAGRRLRAIVCTRLRVKC